MLPEKTRSVENPGVGMSFYALTPAQVASLVATAVTLWFGAALCVHIGSPLGIFGPITSLISFAVAVPISWLSVRLTIKIVRLKIHQIVPGISFGIAVATFCDGIALTWGSWLYGSDPAQTTLGAAWILWGVFTFTAAAFVEAYRRESRLK
jgi:hypothetical protein